MARRGIMGSAGRAGADANAAGQHAADYRRDPLDLVHHGGKLRGIDRLGAVGERFVWLVVIAAINSVIGAYYYLRVIIAMYFWPASKDYTPTAVAPALSFALFLAAAGTLYLGLLPGRVLALAKTAAESLPLR